MLELQDYKELLYEINFFNIEKNLFQKLYITKIIYLILYNAIVDNNNLINNLVKLYKKTSSLFSKILFKIN